MSNRSSKNVVIIFVIIEIGYFLRGSLPSMCYYTPFLSKYINYPSAYIFNLLDYIFLFSAVCVGIFGIKSIKILLKIFSLIQPIKLVSDIIFGFIPSASEGFYQIYPMVNFYLLIISIVLINTHFINHGKIRKQILKPIVFCALSILLQFLIYLIPTSIYFAVQFSNLQEGSRLVNAQMPFIMLIIQFAACNILQVIGGNLLIKYSISLLDATLDEREKTQNLIIYGITILGSLLLLLLFYKWINMPNSIIEIIKFGFGIS